jgi:hypothetical protein
VNPRAAREPAVRTVGHSALQVAWEEEFEMLASTCLAGGLLLGISDIQRRS